MAWRIEVGMVFQQLEQLITTFDRDLQIARDMQSPNEEDDLAVKAAIVGFSYHAPVGEWGRKHYDFLAGRLVREFPPGELTHYGPNSENVRLYFSLASGYLLGAYHSGSIGDRDFRNGEASIAGLAMLHLGRLTARPV
jgi:hypothetical protein